MEDITIRDLVDGRVSEQDVFNFVATKLIAQGHGSMNADNCMYNAQDGSHCALGWMLREYEDVPELEGIDSVLANVDPDLQERLEPSTSEFLGDLQAAHDDAGRFPQPTFVESFRKNMLRLAVHHELDASVLADGARE